MRIYLIGYMGSGKSKTAEALSKFLKIPFVDTDELIERETGKKISEIFEKEGEDKFRIIERSVLHSTLSKDNLIIATGGGMPCCFDNMEWMNKNGITVYLEANSGLIFNRLATSKTERPLLKGLNDIALMEQISGHLALRIPFYKQAKITIKAANLNLKELVSKIENY
jgi:shikimate kinase